MKIKIGPLNPPSFSWLWDKDKNILLVGMWFFVLGVDFGLQKSGWYRHFSKTCVTCGKPLNPNSRLQKVDFHGDCRTQGRAMLREVRKRDEVRMKYNPTRYETSLLGRIFKRQHVRTV